MTLEGYGVAGMYAENDGAFVEIAREDERVDGWCGLQREFRQGDLFWAGL